MTAAVDRLLQELKERLGPKGVVRDPAQLAPRLLDERKSYRGNTPGLVLPSTTEEAAGVVSLATEVGVAIVPQGGNTGLCGGATPFV